MPHYIRYLRIGFTLVTAAVGLAVLVLWGASYWDYSVVEACVTKAHRYRLYSARGTLTFSRDQRIFAGFELSNRFTESMATGLQTNGIKFLRESGGSIYAISIAYWLITTLVFAAAAAPWRRWRFGLLTLLAMTTLVALGLALILWCS